MGKSWINVETSRAFNDRLAIAFFDRVDLVNQGFREANYLLEALLTESIFEEAKIRQILSKKYGDDRVSRWVLLRVELNMERYRVEVLASAPEFEQNFCGLRPKYIGQESPVA